MKKISVLMPTFNDAKYIRAAINSLLEQTHRNWELLIVDDGSTDGTGAIISKYVDSRIIYERQDNMGQLNALLKATDKVTGDFVTILHSDDMLSDKMALERTVGALDGGKWEGVFADLMRMDQDGKIIGTLRTVPRVKKGEVAKLLVNGGSNFVSDVFFVKRDTLEGIISSYIIWNMPYWLKFSNGEVTPIGLEKVKPWYSYRVYPENYAQSEIGKFELANGCIRTIVELGNRIRVPLSAIHGQIIRISRGWEIGWENRRSSPKEILSLLERSIISIYGEIPTNQYFQGLLGFYNNYDSKRLLDLNISEADPIFFGKDSRRFYMLMEKSRLPQPYLDILKAGEEGFGGVRLLSDDVEKAKTILKFLNLNTEVVGK